MQWMSLIVLAKICDKVNANNSSKEESEEKPEEEKKKTIKY